MNIVIFAHEDAGQPGRALFKGVAACNLPQSIQQIQTISELKSHLKRVGEDKGGEVLVLLAETRARLEDLSGLSDYLEDRRLILVVPDDAPATLSAAHRLFPRFVAPMADQYTDLCSVIHRMASGNGNGGFPMDESRSG